MSLFDLLGMQGGFSYGFYATGPGADAASQPPGDALFPALLDDTCDAITTISGSLITPERFLSCRTKLPQLFQPGTCSMYAYDYDVLGLALSRAYGMNAADLMKAKIWDPLGMDSAFMSYLPEGDPRADDVVEMFLVGPPAAAFENPRYPNASQPAQLPEGAGVFESLLPDDAFTPDNRLAASLGRFRMERGPAGAAYPGVSGYGEGAAMTFADYGKFLAAVVNRGVGGNGVRVVGEQAWKSFMLPSVDPNHTLGSLPWVEGAFGGRSLWRSGFAGTKTRVAAADGVPTSAYIDERSATFGTWGGYFGTTFMFDVETGWLAVCGENTNGGGWGQAGKELCDANLAKWLVTAAHVDAGAASSGAAGDPLDDGLVVLAVAGGVVLLVVAALATVAFTRRVGLGLTTRRQPHERYRERSVSYADGKTQRGGRPSDRDPLLRMQDRIRPNASPALAARPHATY